MSSSSSSSSSSSWSSCSSSSYAGFVPSTTVVSEGNFEILCQNGTSFLMNGGTAYDGYGNRIHMSERRLVTVEFPSTMDSDGFGDYAYLCVKNRSSYKLMDYTDHPFYVLPHPTKFEPDVLFYMVQGVIAVPIGTSYGYFPPLDSNDVIDGIVIAKVYVSGHEPDLYVRSPGLFTKDGVFQRVDGFNKF